MHVHVHVHVDLVHVAMYVGGTINLLVRVRFGVTSTSSACCPCLLPLHFCISQSTMTNPKRLALSLCALSQATLAFHPTTYSAISHNSRHKPPSCQAILFASGGGDSNTDRPTTGKGTARLSGPKETGATGVVDSVLTLLSSDGASIVLGFVGISICLFNRLIHLDDYDALTSSVAEGADALGRQARADLLAVFASGAILLNGVSKLDVTSALAESVVLDGVELDRTSINWEALKETSIILSEQSDNDSVQAEIEWALESVLDATPAKTAVIMANADGSWKPVAVSGIVPVEESLRRALPEGRTTPILDRFRGGGSTKESYLPTLQALPGRVEFTYLPPNTQEALILPMSSSSVLVLGSDTAKSCTPRDVAWAQVIASRVGQLFS